MNLKEQIGNIDIYLLDQILKGRYDDSQRILDAGCGSGRNLVYFLKQKKEVYGVDINEDAIRSVQELSKEIYPENPSSNFRVEEVAKLSFEADFFDVIISNAVLHFAKDIDHFNDMLNAMWQTLKPNGYLFVRLASSIGIEKDIVPVGKGYFLLPDGSIRFLVDQATLIDYTEQLGAESVEYIKTTNVQGLRCMTTWCLQKV